MTLRKREDVGNWKRKYWLAIGIAFTLEEAIDLS